MSVKQNTTIAFKVLQCNKTEKGNYITKLNRKITAETPFGTKEVSETYYVSGTKEMPKDSLIAHNTIFPLMRIKEHQMVNPDSGEAFMGKWLHVA